MKKVMLLMMLLGALAVHTSAVGSPFTSTSPSGLDVTTLGIGTVGGVVTDMVGTNGSHVVRQVPASSLFVGYASSNPFVFGIQSGFTPTVMSSLGGGLSRLAVRITLYDGDSALGDFDYGQLALQLNGYNVGSWSAVNAQYTDANGVENAYYGMSGGGFRDGFLDTGWFDITNSSLLSSLYSSIGSSGQIAFAVDDLTPYDNYFDFIGGVSGGVAVPEIDPSGMASVAALVTGALGLLERRRLRQA